MAQPIKRDARLRNYIYVAERLVNSYFDQISHLQVPEKVGQVSVSLSLAGPKVEMNQSKRDRDVSLHEKIQKLEGFLEVSDDLAFTRPQESSASYGVESKSFVLEAFTARKVIIPCKGSKLLPKVDHFVAWISDPDPSVYVNKDYCWRGTFLYLVEGWHDQNQYHSTYSGCSALQFLMNIAEGKSPLALANDEPLGRGSHLHPIEKLKRLGSTVLDARRLLSLYRKRYVTNEQCYDYDGEERRVNDLVGYPVYLADIG